MPLVSTLADGVVYKALIAVRILQLNPNVDRVWNVNPQCILSNAFSASSDKNSAGVFEHSKAERIFRILLVPSGACLPLTNPTWSDLTREGRT